MCFGLSVIAAHPTAQFAASTNLVEVYATVRDVEGRLLTGLPREAFTVEEGGRPQPVQAFAAGNFPLSLAVAVDHSFSVPRDRLAYAVNATQRMLGALRPEDRVTMLGIGSGVEVLTPLSIDHRAAYDAVATLAPWGTTPLFDATVAAIDAVQGASGRRALVLVTDGSDRYSAATAAEMVAYARRRDVLVYPVTFGKVVPPVLNELAAVTGARAVAVPDVRALTATLTGIADELRQQYLIGYAPGTGPSGWRSITVKVSTPGARVRAREGYVAP